MAYETVFEQEVQKSRKVDFALKNILLYFLNEIFEHYYYKLSLY